MLILADTSVWINHFRNRNCLFAGFRYDQPGFGATPEFAAKFAASFNKPIDVIPDEEVAIVKAHDWPGNLRELQNLIDRAVLFSPGSVLRLLLGLEADGEADIRGGASRRLADEIVAANLLDNDPRKVSDRITAYALFLDPPLGRAGLTEAEVRNGGRRALMGRRPMTKVGRAVEKGETQGFMKIIVDAQTHEILGAAILGTGGDEAIHSILDVMYAKAPYTVIQRAVHIHPTVSELIPTLLGELQPLSNAATAAG